MSKIYKYSEEFVELQNDGEHFIQIVKPKSLSDEAIDIEGLFSIEQLELIVKEAKEVLNTRK